MVEGIWDTHVPLKTAFEQACELSATNRDNGNSTDISLVTTAAAIATAAVAPALEAVTAASLQLTISSQ